MKKRSILISILCLSGLTVGGIFFTPAIDAIQEELFAAQCDNQWVATNPSLTDIREQAKLITTKIYSKDSGGSGVIIARQNNTYTILTNQHVLSQDSDFQYQVKMPDGEIYDAEVVRNISFAEDDIALLEVRSEKDYPTANIAPKNSPISPKDTVYATGFPYDKEEVIANEGKIIQQLSKSFEGGYQVGYTNDIQKGMSGGPVLNKRGELIAINGILAYPLFGKKYIFDDGITPTEAEQELMQKSSWSIPIHTVVSQAPDMFPPGVVRENNALARQILVFIDDIDDVDEENKRDSNGSGVIIARDGNTYTVLTSAHTFTGKRSSEYINQDPTQFSIPTKTYEILTADGKCHSIDRKSIRFLDEAANLDLAVFKFTSRHNYSVAKLADYQLATQESQWIFVSGWYPTETGISRPLNPGVLFSKEQGAFNARNSDSQTEGYELVYTNQTKGGMSGGPILDTEGRLIGIHGRADGTNYNGENFYLGYSLGIPVSKFLNVANLVDINPENLEVATNKPQQTTDEEKTEIYNHFQFDVPSEEDGANAWINFGNQLWRFFEYDYAIIAYNEAIKKDPDSALGYYAKGLAQRNRGYNTNNIQYHREALESFENAIKYQNNFYEAWREKARTLLVLKNEEEYPNALNDALFAVDKAIKLSDTDINLYVLQSSIYFLMERFDKAKESLDEAIILAKYKQPMLYVYRGNILGADQKLDEAERDFSKAIELDENSPDIYLARASFYYNRKQDINKAEVDFAKAIDLNPDYAEAYYQRGNMRLNWGKYRDAIKDYDQVIKILPYSPAAYYQRGFAYRWVGNTSDAFNDFSKAAEFYKQQDNTIYAQEAEKRAKDLRDGVERLALFEGKAWNKTAKKGSKISIEILELDRNNKSIKIQVAWSQGLYGEGQLSGTIDENNNVTTTGETFGFQAGGLFQNQINFQIVDNQIINATYTFIPKGVTTHFNLQEGEFYEVSQTEGEPLELNQEEEYNYVDIYN
ncbi:tetratricopeptide repeat-containing serine protease family protein [Okeania sp. SIO2B3]|uniref:tetratricopeptide repeat-containing S1 family peptidase n=1 Tax=Okeania sp. SIO2B3 TaxID=2607784 RepID=UPI0013C279B1|nr:tetratricopeptide repeat-containing serine protease family protein [Okeania sp. SIO2B3]NET45440.1 serine protease [Okeania sp. SIO2B3]